MLNYLKNELNKTQTLNGADAFKSTQSAILDLFSRAANLRGNFDQLNDLIVKAFNENPELALRALFYVSDIRGGQGTRDAMKAGIKVLIERYPSRMENLIPLIPTYTRWDMLYEFVGTKFERAAFQTMMKAVVSAQKTNDYLVFKWLKSADATSKQTRHLGYLTAQYFGMTLREYRKFLTEGRKKLDLVENALTHKKVETINYAHVPSKANLKYRTAFFKHDEDRYRSYLEKVMSGEKKMNMSVGYPHEIVSAYRRTGRMTVDPSLEAAWKSLPNFTQEEENMLVVCDVSGSMGATINKSSIEAMDVSVGLAIYTAQRNKGFYHNHFITFSQNPELLQISERDSLKDIINRVLRSPWGMNTDIDKVFELILNTATKNRLNPKDLPSTILIVSDMQFDSCVRGGRNFINWKNRFEQAGYKLPAIVFWNVMDYGNTPVKADDSGAAIVGGYSPSILKFIYSGVITTPYELMLTVLMTPRYDAVVENFRL